MEKRSREGFDVVPEYSEQQNGPGESFPFLRETYYSLTTSFADFREKTIGKSKEEMWERFLSFCQDIKGKINNGIEKVTDEVKCEYTKADTQVKTQEEEKERARCEILVMNCAEVMFSFVKPFFRMLQDVVDFLNRLWNWIKSCATDIYEKITSFINWLRDAYFKFFK